MDWWHGDAPLHLSFPTLFSYCSNQEISIRELSLCNWDLGFRHSLSPVELASWQDLSALFPTLSEADDGLLWPHTTSGKFSVKSLYSTLVQGHHSSKFKGVWKARVPPKIKAFLWQAIRKRLLASDQIIKWHGTTIVSCCLCGRTEQRH